MNHMWKDTHIIITGGTSGIGLATAEYLAVRGAFVILNGRDRKKGEEALQQIRSKGGDGAFVPGDVGDEELCKSLVEQTISRYQYIDGLVTSAGYYEEKLLENVQSKDINNMFRVNVYGTMYMCRATLPYLKARHGSIVLVSSDAALQGNVGCAVYCATKGAVNAFGKALALELAPHAVRVNMVCPGDVKTPLLEQQMAQNPDATEESIKSSYPLYRICEASEVASVIAFLLSPEASYITATAVPVDGGLTSW